MPVLQFFRWNIVLNIVKIGGGNSKNTINSCKHYNLDEYPGIEIFC
jgi:hypothetical protein